MLSSIVITIPLVLSSASTPQVTFLPAGTRALDVSDNGSIVAGTTSSDGFQWTDDGTFTVIKGAAAGTNIAIAGDGSAMTADVVDEDGKQHAARWQGGRSGSCSPRS